MPLWLAVTEQLPAASKVRLLPLTVQTELVVEARVTASPDEALALKLAGVMPKVCAAISSKVIVCAVKAAATETVKLFVTAVAGR